MSVSKVETKQDINRKFATQTISAVSLKELTSKAEAGDANAQCLLAKRLLNEESQAKQNIVTAVGWMKKAALQNHAEAQYRFGQYCQNGFGAKIDMPEAIRLIKLAAAQDHLLAKTTLANRYKDGKWSQWGFKQDIVEAIKLFEEAAKKDCALAQYNLGYCYRDGEGVKVDKKQAEELFRKAAKSFEQEEDEHYKKYLNQMALLEVAIICLNLDRTTPEQRLANPVTEERKKEGYELLKSLAAEKGMPDAQYFLGLYTTFDLDNEEEGNGWIVKAAMQGHPIASKMVVVERAYIERLYN